MDNNELDRRVVEALELNSFFMMDGSIHVYMKPGSEIIFSPSTDSKQAIDLQEKYEINIIFITKDRIRASIPVLRPTSDGLSKWRDYIYSEGSNVREAICKVIVERYNE